MRRAVKGSAVADMLVGAAVVVFVILPLFSVMMERYTISIKAEMIRDAVDMTNMSTYNAMNAAALGKGTVTLEQEQIPDIYQYLLARNLKLEGDLSPEEGSIAEGPVQIESLKAYPGGTGETCPDGTFINRPSVHSCLIIPVKPLLFEEMLLQVLGKQYIELKIHVDTEIPVNQ